MRVPVPVTPDVLRPTARRRGYAVTPVTFPSASNVATAKRWRCSSDLCDQSIQVASGYFPGSRFRQRATAAFRALSRRSSAVSRFARAFPPFFPKAAAWGSFGFVTLADGSTLSHQKITLFGRLDLMRSATHNVRPMSPGQHRQEHDRRPNHAGLAALVRCLRRYVEAYPTRFAVIERTKRKSTIRTIIRGNRGVTK
jgi:hypothetical protein